MNIHYIKNTLKKYGIENGQVVDSEKLAQSPICQELEKLAATMKPRQLARDSFQVGPALVTVSTVCAYGCHETLVFDHLDNELFFSTSSSTEKAMETHRAQCEIYRTQQQKAIRKKQQEERLRLRMEQDPRLSAFSAALRSAASAAVALKLSTDSGTCNFDAPASRKKNVPICSGPVFSPRGTAPPCASMASPSRPMPCKTATPISSAPGNAWKPWKR